MRLQTILLAAAFLALVTASETVRAHEGHAALPTRGAKVEGEHLYLTEAARKAIGLTTGKVELADLERVVSANATVEVPFGQMAFVTTLVSGRIESVLVGPGERVVAGQELARVESRQLETLQFDLLQATAELEQAQRTLDRREMLSGQGAVAGKDLQAARADRQAKAAELRIVRLKLAALGLADETLDALAAGGETIRTLSLTSPIDGVVADADVRAGQIVEPTEHLYHIVDASKVWIVADVLESHAALVAADMPVRVSFEALGGRTFEGAINYVASAIDPERRTLSARMVLDNADGALRPGQFGRARIVVARAEQTITCPTAGLIRRGGKDFVLLEEGPGKYLRKPVSLGMRSGKRVEIVRGLFPGDRVVLVGNRVLESLYGRAAPATETGTPAAPPASAADESSRWLKAQARVDLLTARKTFASASIAGRVARVLVREGERVEAGQVVAEINSLELRNLQFELLAARVRRDRAQSLLENLESVGEVAAKKEVWELRTERDTAELAASSAARQLAIVGVSAEDVERLTAIDLSIDPSAGDLLASLPVRAPAAGIVAGLRLAPGQVVSPEQQLVEIHDPGRVSVQAFVFEQEAVGIRVGQRVRVRLPADPAFAGEAVVVRASPQMTGAERVLSVWAELDNADLRLKAGMSAWMEIEVDAAAGDLAAERGGAIEPLQGTQP